ncbi:MAG: rod shape-determining protein RodA [Actinomycetota bacterium]|nr:rod shape-determining protein RodA [Actinomycetota bacterium]
MATILSGHESAVGRRERHPVLLLLRHVDLVLIGSAVALGLIGVVMVYSATRAQYGHYYFMRQLIWAGLGIMVMFVVMLVDYRHFRQLGYVLYGLVVLSLVGVFVVGKSAAGAQRWYQLGALQLQPSEFAAIGLIIALATYASHRKGTLEVREIVALVALAGVPMMLVYLQPDLGTAIVLGVTLAAMLVVAGVRLRYLVLLAVLVVLAVVMAIELHLLKGYQLQRLTGFLHQNQGLQSTNYDLNQSKETIASGGLQGTGLFRGAATNLGYVPNQQTDFIFSAVGEQLGFVGSALVIGLFGMISLRALRAAQLARDSFGRLVCVGALAFVAFSAFENIGMTIGLTPISGIPLPFISYGGSASFAFFATVGLVANVEMRRMARK